MWVDAIRACSVVGSHHQALSLFLESLRCSSRTLEQPTHLVFGPVLKSCAALLAIHFGTALHAYVLKRAHVSCHAVSKGLLNMYAKCGKLDDCKRIFSHTSWLDDPVVWNIIISGFSWSRFDHEAVRLFGAMHSSGEAKPNPVTIATVLPICARLGDLNVGRFVHSYAVKSGFETNNLVGNALVSMYAKCGLACFDAYAAFRIIGLKDVVSWNAIITGLAENRLIHDTLRLFSQMMKGPTEPNYVTIATVLPVCASLDRKIGCRFGKEIHSYVIQRLELLEDVCVCNALLSFYSRIGKMEEAEYLFERMNVRDLVSWNTIMSGYTTNSQWLKAMDVFHSLVSGGTGIDSVTIVSTLPACAHLRRSKVGKTIHGYIIRRAILHKDVMVGNSIITYYANCKNILAAHRTFSMMSRRDLITWNSILDAFAESGYYAEFMNTVTLMFVERTWPDSITLLIMIRFCVNILKIDKVKEAHGYSIRTGFLIGGTKPTIGNAILDAYAKCGAMKFAYNVFQSLSGKTNLVTFNSMISNYINCGSHNDARMLFNEMSETDVTTWNLMIRVYAENGLPNRAIQLLHELQETHRLRPDGMTVMSLIPICAQMASVHLLRQCHGYVLRSCLHDVRLMGAVLDTYAKCGIVDSAYAIYRSSSDKDLVMLTAMIGGFAMNGRGEEALALFSHMLEMGLKPDNVIITAVLSACSHAGLVTEGLKIFNSIEVHGIKPTIEQYACVVDLLARSGRVNEAFSFVKNMPTDANANIWGTLLGACKTHNKIDLGRMAASKLFEIEAENVGNYVVMANIYASEARWEGVAEVRQLMRSRDLKKPAGCSWIEIERARNIFIAEDCSHPERSYIYRMLRVLDKQIKNLVG